MAYNVITKTLMLIAKNRLYSKWKWREKVATFDMSYIIKRDESNFFITHSCNLFLHPSKNIMLSDVILRLLDSKYDGYQKVN